jgi:hypothetical protein
MKTLGYFVLSSILFIAAGCRTTGKSDEITTDTAVLDTDETDGEVRYAKITGSGVNARKGPGIDYRVEFQVDKGEKVKVIDTSYPGDADTTFTVHDWKDDGQGNYSPPHVYTDAVLTDAYKVSDEVSLNKGMAVKVCFSADPGGHGRVHAIYVIEGVHDTLKLHDMPMVNFRKRVKPLGAVPWYKIETSSGNKGWVYGDYVSGREVTD